ncbi:MAG: serine/threonine-protein kinase [Planctomycetota bacterium]
MKPSASFDPSDPVEALVAEVLAASDGDHDRALDEACRSHPELADRLRSQVDLLRQAGMLSGGGNDGFPERLGAFVLEDRIGGGGMGIVYSAIQEPLGRRVALKLVRPEHLYFPGSKQRFQRETEVVARLQHPGIVPIFTVGEEHGIPYFAMELVDGRSLAAVVAELEGHEEPPEPGALGLGGLRRWSMAVAEIGRQVALALAHAHERGVTHRDVKPSNVLVTPDGRALLIDFGLASGQGSATLTRSGSQPGTVAYMSPEQLRGEAVDARSDVYSLGVTLYELYTLRRAFDADSDAELRERILAGRPPTLYGTGAPRDLAIVLEKAMAPEPARRYQSAGELAADLDRILHRLPILARRIGPVVRARRFLERHPAVAVALVLGLLLVVGLPTALLVQERAASARIAKEAEVARRVTRFVLDLFREADPALARGHTLPARTVFDRGVARMDVELADQPEVRAELASVAGEVYYNLGLFRDSEPLLREALRLRGEVLGQGGTEIARAKLLLARLLHELGRFDEAVALYEEAHRELVEDEDTRTLAAEAGLGLAVVLAESGKEDEARERFARQIAVLEQRFPEGSRQLALALGKQASFLLDFEHYKTAEPVFRRAWDMIRATTPEDHPDRIRIGLSYAICLSRDRTIGDAGRILDEVLAQAERIYEPGHPMLAEVRLTYGNLLVDLDQPVKAEPLIRQALEVQRQIYPEQHPVRINGLRVEGFLLIALGRYPEAAEKLERATELYREFLPDATEELADLLNLQAEIRFYNGQIDRAEALARESRELHRTLAHGRRDHLGRCLANLARILAVRGKQAEAVAAAKEAVTLAHDWFGEDHVQYARAVEALANTYLFSAQWRLGRDDPESKAEFLELAREGEAKAREALAIYARSIEGDHSGKAYSTFLLGWALNQQGRLPEAEEASRQSVAMFDRLGFGDHPNLTIPLSDLGVAIGRQGRYDEAATCLERSLAIRRKTLPPDSNYLALAMFNLASLREMQKRYADSEALVWECLEVLGRANLRGDIKAIRGVELLLRHANRKQDDGKELGAFLERLRGFAVALLPEGHRALVEIDRRLARLEEGR